MQASSERRNGESNDSNLGFAILGEVVERVGGGSYESLLRKSVLTPLGLADTGVTITAEDEKRIPSGYWVNREPVARPQWQMGEVVSFAGMHSTRVIWRVFSPPRHLAPPRVILESAG